MGSSTPYDDSFRTLLTDCPKLVIPLVNEMFSEAYDMKEAVTLYQNEHFLADAEERISDSNFSIGPDKRRRYNIECQSNRDGSIIIRLFEYGAQVAQETAEGGDGWTTFRFPNSGVLYLRSGRDERRQHLIRILTPAGELEYRIPMLKIRDYTIETIFAKKLWFLIPFYFFNYRLEHLEKSEEARESMILEYTDIFARLGELVRKGELTEYERQSIRSMCERVALALVGKYENVRKGVETVMTGRVLDYEAKDILREGIRTGEEKGKKEGKEEGALTILVRGVRRKLEKNKSPENAAEELEQELSSVLAVMEMIREHPEESDAAIVRRLMRGMTGKF